MTSAAAPASATITGVPIACASSARPASELREGRQRDDDGGGQQRGRTVGARLADPDQMLQARLYDRLADVFREGALRRVASDDELGSLEQRARAGLFGEACDRFDQDFGLAGRGAIRDEIDDALVLRRAPEVTHRLNPRRRHRLRREEAAVDAANDDVNMLPRGRKQPRDKPGGEGRIRR